MRLDIFISENFPDISRQKAITLIKDSQVLVNDIEILKPSYNVKPNDNIQIKTSYFINNNIYCSRAAFKLQRFLHNHTYTDQIFYKNSIINESNTESISNIKNLIKQHIHDSIILDVGASAGGFSQVLLDNHAKLVICQDIGHMQLDSMLRNHNKIYCVENIDIRDFAKNIESYKIHIQTSHNLTLNNFNLIVCDISFISLRNVIDSLRTLGNNLLLLFKPQFEVGIHAKRNKHGVVLESKAIQNSLKSFIDLLNSLQAKLIFTEKSLLKGKRGNEEFFIFCQF